MLLQTGTHTTHKARADFWTLIFEFKFTEALYSLQLFDSEELHMFYCEVSRRAATKSQTFHDWLVERLILKTGVMVISMAGAADNSLEALTEQVRPGLGVLAAFMDTESAKGFFSKLVRDRIAASDTLAKCAVVQLAREGVDDEQLRSLAPRRCLGARMGPESATPYGCQARPHLDPQMWVVLNIFGTPPPPEGQADFLCTHRSGNSGFRRVPLTSRQPGQTMSLPLVCGPRGGQLHSWGPPANN